MNFISLDYEMLKTSIDNYVLDRFNRKVKTHIHDDSVVCSYNLSTKELILEPTQLSKNILIRKENKIITAYDPFSAFALSYLGRFPSQSCVELIDTMHLWLPIVGWQALKIQLTGDDIVSLYNPTILRSSEIIESDNRYINYFHKDCDNQNNTYIYRIEFPLLSHNIVIHHNGEKTYKSKVSSKKKKKSSKKTTS